MGDWQFKMSAGKWIIIGEEDSLHVGFYDKRGRTCSYLAWMPEVRLPL